MAKKILILAANPRNTVKIRVNQEFEEIKEIFRGNKHFVVEENLAVTPNNLSKTLSRHKPDIVHFIGHGKGEGGMTLEDDDGLKYLVGNKEFTGIFKHFTIECLYLNPCYSIVQAKEMAHIKYVIGMQGAIENKTAKRFSTEFYSKLAQGEDYESAFEFARSTVELIGLPDTEIPILFCNHGVGSKSPINFWRMISWTIPSWRNLFKLIINILPAAITTSIGAIVIIGIISFPTITEKYDIEQIKPSIVKIISQNRVGTGFVIQKIQNKTYILTVAHVVEGDHNPTIKFLGDNKFKATVRNTEAEFNPNKGLALLLLETEKIPNNALPLNFSEKHLADFNLALEKRDKIIFTYGFPRGGADWAYAPLNFSGTKGRDLLFLGGIKEGNSGGPLIRGEKVIGIITTNLEPFTYATSALTIREFILGSGVSLP